MGNCLIHHHSSTTFAGDDWGSLTESDQLFDDDFARRKRRRGASKAKGAEGERLLGEKKRVSSTEVKIKISKKQLEELLGTVDIQGMSIEQLLSGLMNASSDDHHLRHRQWKPVLQSIPEVN